MNCVLSFEAPPDQVHASISGIAYIRNLVITTNQKTQFRYLRFLIAETREDLIVKFMLHAISRTIHTSFGSQRVVTYQDPGIVDNFFRLEVRVFRNRVGDAIVE
jgi:hypothetical protein